MGVISGMMGFNATMCNLRKTEFANRGLSIICITLLRVYTSNEQTGLFRNVLPSLGRNQWRTQDFPLGGATSDTNTFWQKHLRKRKNWILLEGAPPPWIRQWK